MRKDQRTKDEADDYVSYQSPTGPDTAVRDHPKCKSYYNLGHEPKPPDIEIRLFPSVAMSEIGASLNAVPCESRRYAISLQDI